MAGENVRALRQAVSGSPCDSRGRGEAVACMLECACLRAGMLGIGRRSLGVCMGGANLEALSPLNPGHPTPSLRRRCWRCAARCSMWRPSAQTQRSSAVMPACSVTLRRLSQRSAVSWRSERRPSEGAPSTPPELHYALWRSECCPLVRAEEPEASSAPPVAMRRRRRRQEAPSTPLELHHAGRRCFPALRRSVGGARAPSALHQRAPAALQAE